MWRPNLLVEINERLKCSIPGAFNAFLRLLSQPGCQEERAASMMKATGYMHESFVIRMAEQAGFTRDATSDINRNSDNNDDHPEGVWNLPPGICLQRLEAREKT